MIEHPVDNVSRSIPHIMDGLKIVQRKILHGSYGIWKASLGSPKAKTMKLSNLSASIAESMYYHHGDSSINGAISLMNLSYIGSNNMRYFFPDGQFGTRDMGGTDGSAARYPFTKPEWWWPYVYRKEDLPSLSYVIDEGTKCEPHMLLPIIPMAAVNGVQAVSTGFSTLMPNHDPRDLIMWLRTRINNALKYTRGEDADPLPYPIPWYRGYDEKGTIRLRERAAEKRDSNAYFTNTRHRSNDANEEEIEGDEEDDDGTAGRGMEDDPDNDVVDYDDSDRELRLSMITEGRFQVTTQGRSKKKVVLIDELPIGTSQNSYKEWLEKQMLDTKDENGKAKKPLLKDFDNKSKHDTVHFVLYGLDEHVIKKLEGPNGREYGMKKLKLRRTFGMTNMVFQEGPGKMLRFDNIQDFMEAWYSRRMPYYELRKQNTISDIDEKIRFKTNKARLIRAVLDGFDNGYIPGKTVVVQRKKRSEVFAQMDQIGITHDAYTNARLSNLDEDDILKLEKEIGELEEQRSNLSNTEPGQLWLNDLEDFESHYFKHYKCEPKQPTYYTGFQEEKSEKPKTEPKPVPSLFQGIKLWDFNLPGGVVESTSTPAEKISIAIPS